MCFQLRQELCVRIVHTFFSFMECIFLFELSPKKVNEIIALKLKVHFTLFGFLVQKFSFGAQIIRSGIVAIEYF